MIFYSNNKKRNNYKGKQCNVLFFLCARSRDRTGTSFTPSVFETDASTNSAIRAWKALMEAN